VFDPSGQSTLPDCTDAAISNVPVAFAKTSVAVDLLGFEVNFELFRPQSSGFLSGFVVIILGGKKGRTFRTNPPAIRDNFLHDFSSFSVLVCFRKMAVQVCLNLPDSFAANQVNAERENEIPLCNLASEKKSAVRSIRACSLVTFM
jgi:hypothetical protein